MPSHELPHGSAATHLESGCHLPRVPLTPDPTVQFQATGGGAYKYAELFKERLGVTLRKEDEVACAVSGCNFLLKALRHEAFEFQDDQCHFMPQSGARYTRSLAVRCA